MENNPQKVRQLLRKKILNGYSPTRTLDSKEDHWIDWFAISEKNFEDIKQQALAELSQRKASRKPLVIPFPIDPAISSLLIVLLSDCDDNKLEEIAAALRRRNHDTRREDLEEIRERLIHEYGDKK